MQCLHVNVPPIGCTNNSYRFDKSGIFGAVMCTDCDVCETELRVLTEWSEGGRPNGVDGGIVSTLAGAATGYIFRTNHPKGHIGLARGHTRGNTLHSQPGGEDP